MLLSNATARSLAEDVLTLEFERDGDVKGFLVSGHEKILADAILDLLGVRLRFANVARSGTSPSTNSARGAGKELTGMELIQRELGNQVIGEFESSGGYSDEPPF
jgi:hypothetical protein